MDSRKNWSRNHKIILLGMMMIAIGIVVGSILYFLPKGVDVGLDLEHGRIETDNKQILEGIEILEESIGRALARGGWAAEGLEQVFTKSVERIDKLVAEGDRPEAGKALDEMLKSGDITKFQELLIEDRDKHRNISEVQKDELIQRNREIAVVAYLRCDSNAAMEAVSEILQLEPNDLIAMNQKGRIYELFGQLDEAERAYGRVLELVVESNEGAWEDVNTSKLDAIAGDYGYLGLIYLRRGELDKAEEMHQKSLEIASKIGQKEIMANEYGNLGLVYHTQGESDKAEKLYQKALEIHEGLGNQKGMAGDYGNLGLIYRRMGDLDKAEKLHKKSLEIEEKLGRFEGMAKQYCNLAGIYLTSGELDKSEKMYEKTLDIFKKFEIQDGVERVYSGLGLIYSMRRELDKAEQMYSKALDIDKKLGNKRGMARDYSSLALVYEKRGDIEKAKEYCEKAVELYKKIGMPNKVEEVERWIEGLGSGKVEHQ